MTKISKQARAQDRAARLHQEALNCLTIAVKEEAHSAELIDEALKLAKRSRELNPPVIPAKAGIPLPCPALEEEAGAPPARG